jgi:hypothetical protein
MPGELMRFVHNYERLLIVATGVEVLLLVGALLYIIFFK